MADVEIKVNVDSNASEVFSQDAQSVATAQEQVAASSGTASEATKEASASTTAYGETLKSGQSILSSFGGEMSEVVAKLGEMGAATKEALGGEGGMGMAGIAGVAAAGAAGLAALGSSGGSLVTNMNQLASTLGTDIETADKLSLMFEDAGSNASSLIRISSQLNSVMGQAADAMAAGGEAGGKAAILQQKLGIEFTSTSSSGEVLEATLKRLGEMYEDSATRQEALSTAAQLFGSRIAGQLNPVIANYAELAAKANEQAKLTAAGFEDGGEKAIKYNMAMTDLKVTYDKFALDTLPVFTTALKGANNLFEGLDPSRLFKGDLIPKDWQPALEALGVSAHHAADGESAMGKAAGDAIANLNGAASAAEHASTAFDSLVQKDIAGTVAIDQANRAQAEANRLMGIQTDLEGKALPSKQDLTNATIDSIRASQAKGEADNAAWDALSKSSSAEDQSAVATHNAELASKAAAEAKKGEASATAAAALTLEGQVDLLYKQADATNLQRAAQREYNAEMGIATDLEGNAIPTMQELVNKQLDSIDASKRDAEATREANLQRGIQVDINGKAVKSFQDMVNEEKASILQSQQMAKATEEANRELGITSDSAKTTASSMDSLTTSLNNNTTAWHQQTDAESQAAAKANAMNPANTGAGTAMRPPGYSGGGSVAFFSSGGSGGGTGGGGATSHASGLESVPYDGYPALLDKGERVQTAAEVARGGDTGGSNQPINITLQIPGLPDYIVRVVRNKALQGGFYGVPLGMH